jgi:RNA polymerase sigma-70 factor, ECF subfamily
MSPWLLNFIKGCKLTKPVTGEVSILLKAWGAGDESALDKLIPLVYSELRRMAHYQMTREREGHTLQTTALVNEAYVRLVGATEVSWQNRAHFFALSAQLMRRVLVDHARSRRRTKRGGDMQKVSLDASPAILCGPDADIIELNDALSSLAEIDARKAKIVELRFFGGFSVEETAEALNVSVSTVMNDWKFAKVWLLRAMRHGGEDDES